MIRNVEEAKELLELYKALTIEEVERRWKEVNNKTFIALKVMRGYSGFGDEETCTLCVALRVHGLGTRLGCEECVWAVMVESEEKFLACSRSGEHNCKDITRSMSPKSLLTAVQERIVLLEEAIRLSEKKNEEER